MLLAAHLSAMQRMLVHAGERLSGEGCALLQVREAQREGTILACGENLYRAKVLNSTEDAHVKRMSIFEADEHLRGR
jgi:hypothetical protein